MMVTVQTVSQVGLPSRLRERSKVKMTSASSTRSIRGTSSMLLCALLLGCQSGLGVLSTSSSETVEIATDGPSIWNVAISPAALSPGDDFTVTWNYSSSNEPEPKTTGDLTFYDIDLDQCENGAGSCGCSGNSLMSLCPQTTSCADSDGSYDLSLETTDATTGVMVGNVYQIRVSLASDPTIHACGPGFKVLEGEDDDESSVETTVDGGTARVPSLEVIAPTRELIPGQAFTARWAYDNGEGDGVNLDEGIGSAGDFLVNLYTCADGACGNGSCGTFVVALCGKGCYDPGTGDYDVVVPADLEPGTFNLYVKETSDGGPSDCASFDVSDDRSVATPTPQALATSPPPTNALVESTLAPTTKTPAVATEVPILDSTAFPTTAAPTTAAPTTAAPTTAAPTTVPPTMAPSVAVGEPGSPGFPPTPVPDKEACDPAAALTISYAEDKNDGHMVTVAHASGRRAEAGCVTLTKIWNWLQTANDVPEDLLSPVATATGATGGAAVTGVWILKASLYIINGVTLELKGAPANGDCDELRIRSSDSEMHFVMGHGGNIDIYKTKIQSWDESIEGPVDLGIDSEGEIPRSYISCVSEIVDADETCEGLAKNDMGECRMDMEDSELGYLGYDATESYGLSWKVRGLCLDLSNLDLFDSVDVRGNIINCDIHHMWYGMYSYGHIGGIWINNRVHDNHVYGFDPHDDSDYLTIHNNTVWNNAKHGIIASKRCNNLSIKFNHVNTSGGNGIMLHRSCDDSLIIDNEVYGSSDTGIALTESSRTFIAGNIVSNGKWGARLSLGAADNQIIGNLFEGNHQHDFYLYEGADEPEVATSTCMNNTFDSNTVNYASSFPINTQDSEYTTFSNNSFSGTGSSFKFNNSHYTKMVGNTGDIMNSTDQRIEGGSCFTEGSQLGPTCS